MPVNFNHKLCMIIHTSTQIHNIFIEPFISTQSQQNFNLRSCMPTFKQFEKVSFIWAPQPTPQASSKVHMHDFNHTKTVNFN